MSHSFEITISKTIGARTANQRTITADFTAGPGITALFGPSGIGKTSILHMVAGLLQPDSGHIMVAGESVFHAENGLNIPPHQRRIGYIFQDARLFPHRRVRANLLYGHDLAPANERWISLEDTCDFLGIGPLLDRWPRSLSGGEAQRVAIGRALLSAPRCLLMDEPLSSLDMPRREEIMTVIERISTELKVPILYVSHDRQEIDRLASKIISLG